MHRAVDHGKDQSYVLGVLTQDQLAHSMFPLGDSTKDDVRAEAERRGLSVAQQARQPRHLLHLRRRHRWLAAREARRGTGRDRRHRRAGAREHEGTFGFTIGQRKGLRIGVPAADGKPRYVLDIEPVSGTVTVGAARSLAIDHIVGIKPRWCGSVPDRRAGLHGPAARAR